MSEPLNLRPAEEVIYAMFAPYRKRIAELERENAELRKDAERYRWLRSQHEGHTPLEVDADGFPIPQEPNPIAFTVFEPGQDCSLEPVSCMYGTLDATIDAALAKIKEAS